MRHLAVVLRPKSLNNERVKVDPLVRARVTILRERKGWTQAELAAEAGVATNTVGGLEKGRNTRKPQYEAIVAALGVTPRALETGDGLTVDNPIVKGLRISDEALRWGKKYQEADTDIRLAAAQLLKLAHQDPMLILWLRLYGPHGLNAHRRETVLISIDTQEKSQAAERAEKDAAARRKRKKP